MLKQRILTALVLAPIAIAGIFYLPALGFSIFIAAILGVGAWEWANLAGFSGPARLIYSAVLVALMAGTTLLPALPVLIAGGLWWALALVFMLGYPASAKFWAGTDGNGKFSIGLIGLFNLVPAFVALLVLKQYSDSNFLILLLFFLIWGADVGAYFSGKMFGKHKLAPNVSPGKSWEGFIGGLFTAVMIATAMVYWLGKPVFGSMQSYIFILGCAGIVMVSVLGDLVESMFKRNRGIKDSSNLLPGHGGILDRVDSLLSAGPLFAIMIIAIDWK